VWVDRGAITTGSIRFKEYGPCPWWQKTVGKRKVEVGVAAVGISPVDHTGEVAARVNDQMTGIQIPVHQNIGSHDRIHGHGFKNGFVARVMANKPALTGFGEALVNLRDSPGKVAAVKMIVTHTWNFGRGQAMQGSQKPGQGLGLAGALAGT